MTMGNPKQSIAKGQKANYMTYPFKWKNLGRPLPVGIISRDTSLAGLQIVYSGLGIPFAAYLHLHIPIPS